MKPAARLAALILAPLFAQAEVKPAPANPSAKGEEVDFVRFQEDATGAQLQTAIGTYRNAQGVTVELIGAIHIGDAVYYEGLNKRFTTFEALLYEMIGEELEAMEADPPPPPKPKPAPPTPKKIDPPPPKPDAPANPPAAPQGKAPQAKAPPVPSLEDRIRDIEAYISNGGAGSTPKGKSRPNVVPKAPPPDQAAAEEAARGNMSWLHPLYSTLRTTLDLESQLDGIDYSKKNFVHADMTARQFATLQQERGEGFMQIMMRAMQKELVNPERRQNAPSVLKLLEIMSRPDSSTELKRLMGRMFDQMEAIMSGMETEQGSVIVEERNKVALAVLEKELAKGRKRVGIFYGAAHLPDMEERLLSMGFKREKLEWLTAWDLPPEPPPLPKKKVN